MPPRFAPTLLALMAFATSSAADEPYDPLAVPDAAKVAVVDFTVEDGARSRAIPVRVYLPPGEGPAPAVVFSHGLGGSRAGYAYLGRHWAARGYAAVFVQHPGSDDSAWRGVPAHERMAALRGAATARNLALRIGDVPAVLDDLGRRAAGGGPLSGRLDLGRVGMSGHSFGARTAQVLGGQRGGLGGVGAADPRVQAALMLSPSAPRGRDPGRAFGRVAIPWMLLTGTRDDSPIGDAGPASRLEVFPALPPGGKYELVLDGAEHSAFSDRILPAGASGRDPNHHRAVLALSTAFWDAHLRDDPAARAWLDGDGPSGVLEPGDRWRKK